MRNRAVLLLAILTCGAAPADACEPLTWPLPAALQEPASPRDRMLRDRMVFMLRGLAAGLEVTRETLTAPCEATPAAYRDELRAARDPQAVTEAFGRHFRASRAVRGQDGWLPDDLAAFEAETGFRSWEDHVVPLSMVKRLTRRIYRSPEGFAPAISVSETIQSQSGDLAQPVLETEVAIARADGSADWDFYSYDGAGRLADVGHFPAGERPSPLVCLGCHYDSRTRTMSRLMP